MKTLKLTFILIIGISVHSMAQVLEVSKEKNAVLIGKYLAAKDSKKEWRPILLAVPDNTKYAIHLKNVRTPVEYTFQYFSYVRKPKLSFLRLY